MNSLPQYYIFNIRALVPELNHAHLEISDGLKANSTYAQLHLVKEKDSVEKI